MQNANQILFFSLVTFKISGTNDYKTRQDGLGFARLPWVIGRIKHENENCMVTSTLIVTLS